MANLSRSTHRVAAVQPRRLDFSQRSKDRPAVQIGLDRRSQAPAVRPPLARCPLQAARQLSLTLAERKRSEPPVKTLPLSEVYQHIEPGPVVLLTTAHEGRANVMAMSWHMMVEFEPPLVACIVSGANHSFAALRRPGNA
jgi:hypothetical protein